VRIPRSKATTAAALVGALLLGWVHPAAADASGPGRTKIPLVGPDAALDCADLRPAVGEDASESGPGEVLFREDRSGHVEAIVRLRGAARNTSYLVRVIQVGDGTCPGEGAELVTNGKGNGSVRIVQPVIEGSDAVQVFVDIPETGEPPYYRAADRYLLTP
jgi:hypothetical protein